jgi:Holliday junction DNA helicase RuvA
MISSLQGILRTKSPTEITIDVNGVGYLVSISLSTYQELKGLNEPVFLLTHLYVRDDAMQLFGFATEEERRIFELLLSVSGIGPRTALGILSGRSPNDLKEAISREDLDALTSMPSIGKKTAERLIVELRDKIVTLGEATAGEPSTQSKERRRAEALMALSALGFPRAVAEKALRQVLSEDATAQLTVEVMVKRALRRTGR